MIRDMIRETVPGAAGRHETAAGPAEKRRLAGRIILVPVLLAAMCLAGYLLLAAAYCIPTGLMDRQVAESCAVFEREGSYPRTGGAANSQLDNYTDALMLLKASYPENGNVWEAAARVTGYRAGGMTPVETVLSVGQGGTEGLDSGDYARYWHGSLVFLKPLLVFFHYGQIRDILMLVQSGMLVVLVWLLSGKERKLVFPTFLLWVFLNPRANSCSLQFNSVFMLTFAGMVFILLFHSRWKENLYPWHLLFLFLGAATSYFDLLTYPLVTLGVPLALWLYFNMSEKFMANLKNMLCSSAFWVMGYGGLWGGKWVLGSIVTGTDILENAAGAVLNRTVGINSPYQESITYRGVIKRQLLGAWQPLLFVLFAGTVCLLAYRLVRQAGQNAGVLLYVFVSAYPFVWYLVLQEHSYTHYFFTYRTLAVSVYSLAVCGAGCRRTRGRDRGKREGTHHGRTGKHSGSGL